MYRYLQVVNITISLKIILLFFSHNLQAWMLTYLFFCLFSGNIPTSALRATEVNLLISCEPRVSIIYNLLIKKSYVFKTLRWYIVLILKTPSILCFQFYKYHTKCYAADKWRMVVLIFCTKHTWMIPNSQIMFHELMHSPNPHFKYLKYHYTSCKAAFTRRLVVRYIYLNIQSSCKSSSALSIMKNHVR